MNNFLYVWIYPPEALKPVLCGTLELVGGRLCRFAYAESWIEHPGAFELSVDLPLRAGAFEPLHDQLIHPIFEDAGPDRWGRRIIEKTFNLPRRSEIDYLAVAGEDRIGALAFSESPDEYLPSSEQALRGADLGALLAAAQALERRDEISDDMRRLLRPGTSAGGARPKAIIEDQGRRWIAKFPAEGDTVDVCAIEHASLRLAHACGITVPDSMLVQARGRNILLVERFDRDAQGARRHFCSAKTMLLAEGIEAKDASYADLAMSVRRYSSVPTSDAHEVFRRMAFNVLMENTDDHEKNHAFLWHSDRWNLSPAYDIQPQLQNIGYQQLIVGKDRYEPTLQNVMSDCERFMLSEDEARSLLADMLERVSDWQQAFAIEGVSEQDIAQCRQYVRVDTLVGSWNEMNRSKKRARQRM